MTKLYFRDHVWIPQLTAMQKMVLSIFVALLVTELKTGFSSRRFSKKIKSCLRHFAQNSTDHELYTKNAFLAEWGPLRLADLKKLKAGAKGSRGKRNYRNRSTGREVDVNGVHGVAGGHIGHVGSRGEGLRGLYIKFKPKRPKDGWDHGPRAHEVHGVHGVRLGGPQVHGLARGHAGELRYEVSAQSAQGRLNPQTSYTWSTWGPWSTPWGSLSTWVGKGTCWRALIWSFIARDGR